MVKKNKKSLSDAVYAKKSLNKNDNPFATARAATAKHLNPFEVHINKEKFQILGRVCKHDKGLPGISRAKAAKKRKETLGQEFMEKHKTNHFKDRRIGKHLSEAQLNEEIINARFTADRMEKIKQSKHSRFNLNDDEILTHRGQTLADIEQFRDDRSEEDDEENERLDAEFTEAAHFGGGSETGKDRKTAIDEMIVEQKKRKMEIAKEKDEIFNMTEKLDANYKSLVSLMSKKNKSEFKEKPTPDDYDKLMREMIFEPRGVVSDRLQSELELAKQEKERLERLEQERLKRMKADGEEENETSLKKPTHRSADDLDDGYFANGDEDEASILAYNLKGGLETKMNGETNGYLEKQNQSKNQEECDSDEDEEDGEEAASEYDENDDDLSDLKASESEDEEETTPSQKDNGVDCINREALTKPQSVKKTTADLPYLIEMPSNFEEFNNLLLPYKLSDQNIIIERLIKCNHPELEIGKGEAVAKLFSHILKLLNEKFVDANLEDVRQNFQLLSIMVPHLYEIMYLNPERMSQTLLGMIKGKYTEYKKNPKQYPSLEVLIFLKLVSNLCSTSDFRHPVVTPCYIFIQHILSKARIRSRQDIAMGLFLVTLSLEYAQLSKRFLPAAFNYLLGVIYLCIPKRPVETLKILPPFQSHGIFNRLLAIPEESDVFKNIPEQLMKSEDLVTQTINDDFKLRALNHCLKLIQNAVETVKENVGANYLAMPLLEMLERLPLSSYPDYIKTNYEKTKIGLETLANKSLKKLVPPEKKPKALRLLEPRIEQIYDDKRHPKLSKHKEERVKLLHKVKRETKSAVRELRRDTQFLQKMRLQQQLQSDAERREKVKRIFAEASLQQGELNALDRAKKKKKF
uniref:Nucleolar protein 14 n=1 Tax=Glossina palpalis gambiensis TaxID=67801 RepID=A0A1B0C6T0_9MUSC